MSAAQELRDEIIKDEAPQGFVIDNIDKATWAFRRIAALKADNAEYEETAQKEIERIMSWCQRHTLANNASIDGLVAMLAEYCRNEKAKNSKFKLSTPYGGGYYRQNKPELIYADDAADKLAERGLDEFVRISKSVNKAELKKHIVVTQDGKVATEDGEILDFIEAVPKEDTFVLKGVE